MKKGSLIFCLTMILSLACCSPAPDEKIAGSDSSQAVELSSSSVVTEKSNSNEDASAIKESDSLSSDGSKSPVSEVPKEDNHKIILAKSTN